LLSFEGVDEAAADAEGEPAAEVAGAGFAVARFG
jgi:hypothetical protein